MIVVHASVLLTALVDDGSDGDRARTHLSGQSLWAPELIDLEVAAVLRRVSPRPLLARCWEPRHNLTVSDASYAALAESLRIAVVTADARLAGAPGLRGEVRLLT